MKSSLGMLRKITMNKSEPKENWEHHLSVHIGGLTQAAKDMKDMRTCYDSLLSAAAATANSAYEFSESLLEMGSCLLYKTAMHDDGESGGALSLLGRVQLELRKLVDIYRSHIIMTITNPSESLLSELQKVEEMKLQCDEKREMLENMVGQLREKGKSRHGKGETFTSQQVQAVREEYDEAARLCVFRVESLKQGQCRSLLTQAARHHAAQLKFFRKGFQSLEAVEPRVKNVAEKQHIDYELCALNDGEVVDEANSFETNDVELSFDYRQNKQELDNASTSRNSMEDLSPHGGINPLETTLGINSEAKALKTSEADSTCEENNISHKDDASVPLSQRIKEISGARYCGSGLKHSLVKDYLKFLNSASEEELKTVRGIGEKRATYILELREKSPEPFKSLDDLQDIGLSAKQIKEMMKRVAAEIVN